MLATLLPAVRPAVVRAQIRNARLFRAVRAAQGGNCRTSGAYPAPVTITDNGGVLPSQTPKAYLCNSGNSGILGIWSVVGGRMWTGSNNVRASIKDAGGTPGQPGYRIEATAISRYLCVRLLPSARPYRFLVNGRYLSTAGTVLGTVSGSANQYVLLDFGTRASRRICIEAPPLGGVFGAYTEATGEMWPVDLADAVHAAMLGDSYVEGAGATLSMDGPAVQLGDLLGMRMHASGSGGTGWATVNSALRFDQRIAGGDLSLSYHTPDVIFLMASYNDRFQSAATITTNAVNGMAMVRARYADAPIIVFGACPGATGPNAPILQAEAAVQAAVVQRGDPLTAFVPFSTSPLGAAITGTGTVAAPTGTGNSDWATHADAVHPSDEGAAYIARRWADGATAALQALTAG